MKKFTLLLSMLFALTCVANTHMVENFEHIRLNIMLGGENDNSNFTVVPNPDQGEANPSSHVVKYERSQHGVPWGGFWSILPEPMDLTENKYVHVRVWKPRISPLRFKVEGGSSPNLEILSMEPQTLVGEWEDIVFDFSSVTGPWNVIAFMPDFEDPLTLNEDIVIYFDYIMVNNDPTPGSAAVYVVEDFDHIPLNLMLGGENDNSTMTVVPNPAPDEINASDYVVKYERSQFGVPWGGFWSILPVPLDLTELKYVYVKVWKPRISPLRFKVEGGPSANLEIPSMQPQTLTGQWQEIVFDFSEKTGLWNVIAFMPDFEDPLTLTEDIVIYFDDIRTGEHPNVSVPSIDQASKMIVYPNPSNDFINIRYAGQIQNIKIFDVTGKLVYQSTNNTPEARVDVSSFAKGIYVMQVASENNTYYHKINR
jgi:hypothetical protein